MDEGDHSARQNEAEVLAQIGRCLFGQDLRVRVILPATLARDASAAWAREDVGDVEGESESARRMRHRAGSLALIGLAVDERGAPAEGDQIEVELDAWQIGSALDAADEQGLLSDLIRPSA